QSSHIDAVDSTGVRLFESHLDRSSGSVTACCVEDGAIDRSRGGSDDAGVQDRLEAVLAVTFLNDRSAGLEVNIEVFSLACRDIQGSAGDLSGWNLDSCLRLAG